MMGGLAVARSLHVLAVVIWIGGVALVTTVLLPAVRRGEFGDDRVAAFHAIERRFAWQARIAIIVVGATGFYMVASSDLWDRFRMAGFWWMSAMAGVWVLFALLLFVVEPAMHRPLDRLARADPDRFFGHLLQAHRVLLALSAIAILGAVAGSHGLILFDT